MGQYVGASREKRKNRLTFLPVLGLRRLVRLYQLTFSSLVGTQCRHLPTCSAYMDEALVRHGFWPGLFMGLARLSRCHPWGTAGFDPVPEKLDENVPRLQPWRHGHWFKGSRNAPLAKEWKVETMDIESEEVGAAGNKDKNRKASVG